MSLADSQTAYQTERDDNSLLGCQWSWPSTASSPAFRRSELPAEICTIWPPPTPGGQGRSPLTIHQRHTRSMSNVRSMKNKLNQGQDQESLGRCQMSLDPYYRVSRMSGSRESGTRVFVLDVFVIIYSAQAHDCCWLSSLGIMVH
jgi:hypothetical protein